MSRRLGALLALCLAAGCGGGRPDAERDGDAKDTADAADTADARADVPDAAKDAANDAGADRDGGLDQGDDAPDAGDGRADAGDASTETDAERTETPSPSLCGKSLATIKLPAASVAGVLAGSSENSVVSCGGGRSTAGADAFYTLVVDATTVVEVRVDAAFETIVAIRTQCADGVTEAACSSDPPRADPTPSSDAGAEPDAADANAPPTDAGVSTAVRVRLAAGTYTIVVDSIQVRDKPNPFKLTARALAPLSNASCATPLLITAPAALSNQDLTLGGPAAPACASGAASALVYTVGVPPGQRLTARATPTGGDRTWMPRLDASSACGAGACLAQGHTAAGISQVLDWINNGPNWRLVLLTVSAPGGVNEARFDLTVGLIDQLATCARPTLIADGMTLINQDIQRALPAEQATCGDVQDRALYYAASVRPQQTLTATALGSQNGQGSVVTLNVRVACDRVDDGCFGGSSSINYKNEADETKTILIEAVPSFGGASGLFDLHVSIPPGPAGISVTPPVGLATSEGGATATFEVVLRSPPTAVVTIGLASDTPAEGTVSPASVQFDATNWDRPQTVTVKGVDDQESDGARRYTIVTSAAMSSDTRYAGMGVGDVEVTNLDDDPGLSFEGTTNLTTSEAGGAATFTVRLNHAPTSTVRVPLSSNDISEGTVSPAELVFSPTDWSTQRVVTIVGVDDALSDGAQTYSIVVGALASADPAYAGRNPPDVVVHNRDDDLMAVPTTVLSGDRACQGSGNRQIAVDARGTIYVAMNCDSGVLVFTSADGGRSFSEPVVVKNVGDIQELAIVGGAGGAAYVAFESVSLGLMFSRTTDGGATWMAPETLMAFSPGLRLVAAGETVMLAAQVPEGNVNTILWRSFNAGRTFLPRLWLDFPTIELWLAPEGKTVHMLEQGDNVRLRKSTDAGATFTFVGLIGVFGTYALTSQELFASSGSELRSFSLANVDNSVSYGQDFSSPFALVVDDADVLTVLDTDTATSRLKAFRVPPGSAAETREGKLFGPRADFASGVALSRKAVAVAYSSGSLVLFTVLTWP